MSSPLIIALGATIVASFLVLLVICIVLRVNHGRVEGIVNGNNGSGKEEHSKESTSPPSSDRDPSFEVEEEDEEEGGDIQKETMINHRNTTSTTVEASPTIKPHENVVVVIEWNENKSQISDVRDDFFLDEMSEQKERRNNDLSPSSLSSLSDRGPSYIQSVEVSCV